ncbi:unnamed protein product [Parajaminaea phylloscopi]
MPPILELVLVCFGMAAGTFVFGLLPLGLRFSRLTLRILEVSGAGLLLGAAGAVVLPEGASTLLQSSSGHGHSHRSVDGQGTAAVPSVESAEPESVLAISFLSGMLLLFVIDQIMSPGPHCHAESHSHDCEPDESQTHGHQHVAESSHQSHASRTRHDRRHLSRMSRPESMILTRSNALPTLRSLEQSSHAAPSASARDDDVRAATHSPHGSDASVASLPSDYHTLSHQDNVEGAFRHHKSISEERSRDRSDLKQGGYAGAGAADSDSSPSSPLLHAARSPSASRSHSASPGRSDRSPHGQRRGNKSGGLRAAFTSVAGLLIHAACDGIAMGASAASQDQGLKLVVLGAIMIHKAPAAFGLCTLLVSQRLSRPDIKKAMALFALATPIGTLATYFLLSIFLGSDDGTGAGPGGIVTHAEPAVSSTHVGAALTFSAGSFLYVALDAVHELASSSSDYEMDPHGNQLPKQTLGRVGRIAILLIGAMIPKTLQTVFGHGH